MQTTPVDASGIQTTPVDASGIYGPPPTYKFRVPVSWGIYQRISTNAQRLVIMFCEDKGCFVIDDI